MASSKMIDASPMVKNPGGLPMTSEPAKGKSYKNVLEQLNKAYIEAYMSADVAWYEKHLAAEFVCIESDGSMLNKAQFLNKAAEFPDVADYKLQRERADLRNRGPGAGLHIHSKGSIFRCESLHRYLRANSKRVEGGVCTDYSHVATRGR